MRLRELRKAKNLTQTEVAKELNVATNTYCWYEIGKSEPTIDTLKKLADFFNVSLDYLCERKTNGISDYGALTIEQRTAVNILLNLPENKFYEFLGRLKTCADLLEIKY